MGRQLVPRLVAAGHEVHAMTRSESKQAMLEELGAVPVVADALDPDQVAEAVGRARPDVIVHQLTAIGPLDPRHFDRDFALTNRLRTEGTDHLLSAGQAVGVRRFVAQSYGAWWYVRTGGPVKSEEDPLDPSPAREMRESVAAIRHLEETVLGARWTEGIVLRYGAFYGPGTSMAPDGEQSELVRRRKFPLVGDGGGVWSYVHIADAAEATVAAVEHGSRGVDRRRRRQGSGARAVATRAHPCRAHARQLLGPGAPAFRACRCVRSRSTAAPERSCSTHSSG
jgi:nucleoside-diphosphate-sugar epimerase